MFNRQQHQYQCYIYRFRMHTFLPYYYSIKGYCKDGFSYVLYINGGHPPWTLLGKVFHSIHIFSHSTLSLSVTSTVCPSLHRLMVFFPSFLLFSLLDFAMLSIHSTAYSSFFSISYVTFLLLFSLLVLFSFSKF